MRSRISLLVLTLACSMQDSAAQEPPRLEERDRVRLAEVFRLADDMQDKVWAEWSKAPFAVLLVTPETEFLVRHPNPPADFARAGEDDRLGGAIYSRKRVFQTNFLATFPVNGVPTIVVGQAENTQAKTSTKWVITLMHEHFHQLQNSQPDYHPAVEDLGLSRGDTSGMWMLNYDFPYGKSEVQQRFYALCARLSGAVSARNHGSFRAKLAEYRKARTTLAEAILDDDDRYFAFQLWQEGVARYTELRVAEVAAGDYKPSEAFRRLPDFTPYDEVARELREETLRQLTSLPLGERKRVMFYYVGANLALVLDCAVPDWHKRYFAEKFDLDRCFSPPRAQKISTQAPAGISRE